ncbi:MAG: TIGR02281 family clan AA aspartic protease [Paracoccaceae bacterium]
MVVAIALAALVFWQEARDRFAPQRATYAADGYRAPQAPDVALLCHRAGERRAKVVTVDTGASEIVLSSNDARAAGIDTANLAYIGRANTANGKVRTAPVWLESFAIGPILDRSVPPIPTRGRDGRLASGMSYLQHYDIGIKDGVMTLNR